MVTHHHLQTRKSADVVETPNSISERSYTELGYSWEGKGLERQLMAHWHPESHRGQERPQKG